MSGAAKPRVLVLSAYDAGSHQRWRHQLTASQPDFDWHCLSLPPRFFRWRIRGNPLSWLNEPLLRQHWDLLVVTSMVDLATLKGIHRNLAQTPAMLYMHENQFAYPDSGQQHASVDPQMVNLYSAIAADRVLFNSDWNRTSFFAHIETFLAKMPDAVPTGIVADLTAKALTVPVPIDDRLYVARTEPYNLDQPHLLWNHRWEYDKGPDRLLALLRKLVDAGQLFRLSVVGEQFRREPEPFARIRQEFADRIVHWGFVESRKAYDRLLASADVVLSTAVHDFQGLAMLEAMASGCLALAPDRLAYREYVPASQRYKSVESDLGAEAASAAQTLMTMLASQPHCCVPEHWRLSALQPTYRQILTALSV